MNGHFTPIKYKNRGSKALFFILIVSKVFVLFMALVYGALAANAQVGGTNKEPAGNLTTRFYHIPETFMSHLKVLEPPKAGESSQQLFMRLLTEQHIEIQKPATLFLDEQGRRLFVCADQTTQAKIQKVYNDILAGQ
jgi:hypothetical protein